MLRVGILIGCAVSLLFASAPASAAAKKKAKFNKVLNIGDAAPAWRNLNGTDDKEHSLSDLKKKKVVVVTFTCNHCPVARIYEQRFIEFSRKYAEAGVEFVAVSCSSLPSDGFEEMKVRAKEKGYPFAYLHDADQSVGKKYGATRTPQLFVIDQNRKIAYMGAFDDQFIASKAKQHYVRDTVEALLAGKTPEITEMKPKGCEIDYGR